MGLIQKQGFRGSVAIYIGILIGAFNNIFYFPEVFAGAPESMGLIRLILTYSIVVGTFIGAGFPSGIIFFFPKITDAQKQALFGYALLFSGVLFVVASVVLVFFKTSISGFITSNPQDSEPYLGHLLFLVIFYVLFELLAGIMQSFRLVVFPVFLKDVGRKFTITLLLFATQMQWINGVEQFMAGLVIFYGIMIVWLAATYIQQVGLKFSFKLKGIKLGEITQYNMTIFLTATIYLLVSSIDTMMLGSMMETTSYVAFYLIAYQIGSIVWTPAKSLNRAIRPVVAEEFANNNLEKINKIYHQSVANQFFVGAFIFLMIMMNLDLIYHFIDKDYAQGKNVVWFIASGFLINTLFGPNGLVLGLSKQYRFDLYLNIFLLIMIVGLNLVFIPKYGVYGAAASTTFTTVLYNIVKSTLVYKQFKIKPITVKMLLLLLLVIVIISIQFLMPDFGIWINSFILSTIVCLTFGLLLFKTKLSVELRDTVLKLPILKKIIR